MIVLSFKMLCPRSPQTQTPPQEHTPPIPHPSIKISMVSLDLYTSFVTCDKPIVNILHAAERKLSLKAHIRVWFKM